MFKQDAATGAWKAEWTESLIAKTEKSISSGTIQKFEI
jgi:hypothetical protein